VKRAKIAFKYQIPLYVPLGQQGKGHDGFGARIPQRSPHSSVRAKDSIFLSATGGQLEAGLWFMEFSTREKEIHPSCLGRWTRRGVMDVSCGGGEVRRWRGNLVQQKGKFSTSDCRGKTLLIFPRNICHGTCKAANEAPALVQSTAGRLCDQ
jgi:hypothetical protein